MHNGRLWRFRVISNTTDPTLTTFAKDVKGWIAALIPGARSLDIPGRDHMLAVGDRVFKTAVLEFLEQRP